MSEQAGIEHVTSGDTLLAIVIRSTYQVDKTTFLTKDHLNQQLGFVVYPAGGTIIPHLHTEVTRTTTGTQETLVVRSGRMEVDLFDDDRQLVKTITMSEGDVITLIAGGHGFRMTEDTILLEIKQGPFGGEADKERFDA